MKLDPDASAIPNDTAMCSHEYRQVNRARTLYFPPKIRLRDCHGTTTNGLGEKTHRSDCANVSMTLWFPKIRRNQLERARKRIIREERLPALRLSHHADNG
ncbi:MULTISPECIES: hypothetical protein [Mesorhizobium]|uniref:hypothetical protein n=1 Tax=Mesorhizobium TaxID=68287 RepID=UPI0012EB6204|nr:MULTISPECIES: hypothetical protein [Mesorhizobium]WJI39901.1 hypothetical protein NL534_06505 [Mesorhizobium opportunistum]